MRTSRRLLRVEVKLLSASWAAAALAVAIEVHAAEVRGRDEQSSIGDERSLSLRLPGSRYYRLLGGVALGRGLRFNNPFRLQTQLGDDAQSLSLTAPYLDLSVGLGFGRPEGVQHGLSANGSIALDGIAQEVVTPAYLIIYQPAARWLLTGRAGLPVIIEPDANVGFEVAARGALLLTASLGLTTEIAGSLFYGAATFDNARSAIPIISMQLGALYQYEVLP